jgi:hypothetical protein
MFRKTSKYPNYRSQASIPAPRGWSKEESRDNPGVLIFTPGDLKAGEEFNYAVYPLQMMNGEPVEVWLEKAVKADPIITNKHTKVDIQPKNGNIATAIVTRKSSGVPIIYLYFGVSFDKESGKMLRMRTNKIELSERYKAETKSIMDAALKSAKQEIVASGRGMSIEKTIPVPPNMKPGGKLVEGMYEGSQVRHPYKGESGSIETVCKYRVYLYESGETRMFSFKDALKESSREEKRKFKYDYRNGKLDIEYGSIDNMSNDSSNPEEDYCVYGYDAAGKPFIYASSDRVYAEAITILRYIGPPDRVSPAGEEAAKSAAEEEAKRYKFVVPPGKGVQPEQIAHVLYHIETKTGFEVSSSTEVYLLLKDGTLHDGLPVPPDELDVALSRRKEPEKWGKWRREGKQFLAAWPDRPNHYETLKEVDVALPAKRNETLSGKWGTGSSSGMMITGSSYRLWGVTFKPDGRFEKYERGGSSNGTMAQTLNDVHVYTSYDDEGSTVSASTPGVFVGNNKTKKKGSDRMGTYVFNSYSLTLRFDNGKEKRIPFFFQDAKKESLYFEGSTLSLDKDKK